MSLFWVYERTRQMESVSVTEKQNRRREEREALREREKVVRNKPED